jgi:hypothetical protein
MQCRTGHAKPSDEINRYRRLMHANHKMRVKTLTPDVDRLFQRGKGAGRGAREYRGNQTVDRKRTRPSHEGKTSMTAVAQLVASVAVKAFVTIKRLFRRCRSALIKARVRRISHEIEFRSRVNTYRRANGMPPLNLEDLRGRF